MKLTVKRFADNGNATMSVFQINGVSVCFGIEDEERANKVAGETRVPEGTYNVSLRAVGGYHGRELERYGSDYHKGMLCIHNAAEWKIVTDTMEFQYILIHPGNTERHTNGCYLPNFSANFTNYQGGSSRAAYEKIYPMIRDVLMAENEVTIEFIDIEEGR
jgi:hypothetical protein